MNSRSSGTMWRQLFLRGVDSGLSLQGQIRQMMVSLVLDGQLPEDLPIPSSRDMANILGVARNTVVIAYQNLVDEGYLVSRERRGYFVNPMMLSGHVPVPPAMPAAPQGAAPDWERRFRFAPSRQRNIRKRANWRSYPYPFIYGQFDADLFPISAWRDCCLRTLSALEVGEWAQDMILRDDESLIKQLRSRVLPRRGVWAGEDEVVITVGAQHALYLIADLLLGPDTPIGVEDPGYPDARNIFSSRSDKLVLLPVDEDGLIPDEALRNCDYVYVTPSYQCPTTVSMSLERRRELLRMADEFDFVIIEDDYESEYRLDGEPLPSLKSMDTSGRVIYIGSFSKQLAPGVRLGYVVGCAAMIEQLRAVRRLSIRHPTAYMQRVFALFMSLGHLDALLRRRAGVQQERAVILMSALDRYLPGLRYTPIRGGASCWVEGPAWLEAATLAQKAEELGVLIELGEVFFADDQANKRFFRLGFASIPMSHIEPGVARLAQALRDIAPVAHKPAGAAVFLDQ